MIVGTASHAGKSILTTALCRILHQRGIRVAPFKSQNMALNSFVCSDGSEIGRAQAAQAEAAGLDPQVDMNPILLKPAHNRIQVVLQGRVYGTMTASEYYEQKSFFFEKSLESFHRLASKFDVIILEGAGSAVEVNLKDRDIVNLPFAKAVGARALLVADIDRGGVFASIVGTFALLEEEERNLICGFVINRFRGDMRLFSGGTEFLEKRTGSRCFGILPHIGDLRIDQEDSVSLEDRYTSRGSFHVGVVRLPHISNYTDFNPLECIPDAAVEYLSEPSEGSNLDLLIIPGSKNTIADLRWVKERGFKRLVLKTLENGGWVLGICGGYQMLGRRVSDPHGTEEGGVESGLDLLPVETELETNKVTVQSRGRSFLGPEVAGYEIHMGRTDYLKDLAAFITKEDGTKDGALMGRVGGTYFHGLFDSADFAVEFLTAIAESRNFEWRPVVSRRSKDQEYDRLAAVVREHLDMNRIYELVEKGN
jgi:adenosylcobyric acid synthase